mmetsp:Transcript_9152/g.12461  ORF Transcript_9152/g.12461 Transcript_9152/m.12461 type:complete len:154 (+) Transcript_9152:627-1088(+)|eukprot:CAMPEP_0185571634 /NCGR_PEP_ID=MMETSP0434-20130131/3659_1 /TAXON_ID=626734 ORGANISM="Favella taraikaensis, Strain Fe Narragansett Bay" /NCGR_SAMPLE_ID=MMETSP0434 /ASSEMBLY_ACC=CAM_ASM_000379 /LENGTH=153 /DNA_ID=CAMNT_0028187155 /DNA_START=563 /DNA_END=1024 /DNA_ORIENTATION=+
MFKEQHEAVMDVNPNVSVFYSGATAPRTYLWWLLGCIFCCPLKGDVLMTTHVTSRQQERLKDMLAKRGRSGCCINFMISIARCVHRLSPALFKHLKARGNATVIWVANDEEDFNELKDHFGDSLDGIMTDYPQKLADWAGNFQSPDKRALKDH